MKLLESGIDSRPEPDLAGPPAAFAVAPSWIVTDPSLLLSRGRFDLAAKLAFIRWKESGSTSDWLKQLYLTHIDKWNGFSEPGNSAKRSEQDFIRTFEDIIDSIRREGFDPRISLVPCRDNLQIRNGAHRTAAAIYFRKPVACSRVPGAGPAYDHRYFARQGLPRQYLDAMACEYVRFKPNSHVGIIWPAAFHCADGMVEALRETMDLVYQRDIEVTERGHWNVVQQCYPAFSAKGVASKSRDTWSNGSLGKARVAVFDAASLDVVLEAKDRARAVAGLGKHSIHLTDDHAEALQLAPSLLHDASIDALNHLAPDPPPDFVRFFTGYREFLASQAHPERFCLVGSAPMALYGLRDCGDLDCVSISGTIHGALPADVSSHRRYEHLYPWPFDEIIDNPGLHFSYLGAKVASLDVMVAMKQRRGEDKDLVDVGLVRAFCTRRAMTLRNDSRLHRRIWQQAVHHLPRSAWRMAKRSLKQLLAATGLRDP